VEFFLGKSIWIYLFIFFGKILEVSVATLRIMLINRGERFKGSVIAFFEVALWLVITGTVLAGFTNDILKCVVFIFAFAFGNFLGSWLESKLAFGMGSVQVIVPEGVYWEGLVDMLREKNFGVTVLSGEGKTGGRKILVLHLRRKRITQAVHMIKNYAKDVFITVNDIKVVCGGFIKKK